MSKESSDLLGLLSLGVYCAVCIGLGVGLGYLLDTKLNSEPAFTFVGLAIGMTLAFLGAYKEFRRSQEK
jgi:F0F1-type ATP synthase assembly protein I